MVAPENPVKIAPTDLVPMDLFTGHEPIAIDLVYANAQHPENIFGEALYHSHARLSLHKDLAAIVLLCARLLYDRNQQILILKDGLRPIEAQRQMTQTAIVQSNPHWLEGPNRLLSPEGAGAHPRGMAIDVGLRGDDGRDIDMGTVFDTMTERSARSYQDFSAEILGNRQRLEATFTEAAARLNRPLLPLPSEWWDFRFPRAYYSHYLPLSDADLPPPLRMCKAAQKTDPQWNAAFDKTAQAVLNSL